MKNIMLALLSGAMLFSSFKVMAQTWVIGGNALAANGSFGSNNNFSVLFKTNNTERGRLTNSGLWGIGTTAPNTKLHVNSAAGADAFRAQINGLTKLYVHNGGGVSVGAGTTPPANGLYVSGNTGIGTSAPAVKLHVQGGTDASPGSGGFIVAGPVSGANIAIDDNEIMARNNGATTALFLNNNGGNLLINSTNATGNTGIGTASPANRLHVRQVVANRAIEWQHETQADNWVVGIGTFTLNCRFEFNDVLKGQISSVDGSFIEGSDIRLKEEVKPLPALLDKIVQLEPSSYFFKESRLRAKNKSLGFIAQDVEKIFPELVYDFDEGYKGLNYSAFAVIAIKAIQEQQVNIKEQEQRIIEQQEIISSLESRLSKMEAAINAITGKNSAKEFSGVSLEQNSPNPFKNVTTFRYKVPEDLQAQIKIYDAAGNMVKAMNAPVNGQARINGNELKPGTYIYTLLVNGKAAASKKMVLLK